MLGLYHSRYVRLQLKLFFNSKKLVGPEHERMVLIPRALCRSLNVLVQLSSEV